MGTPDLQGLLLLFPLLLPLHGASAGSLHSPGELGKEARPKSLLSPGPQGRGPKAGEAGQQVGGAVEQPEGPLEDGNWGVLVGTRKELGEA